MIQLFLKEISAARMGREKLKLKKTCLLKIVTDLGTAAADELLKNEEAQEIIYGIRNAKK